MDVEEGEFLFVKDIHFSKGKKTLTGIIYEERYDIRREIAMAQGEVF